MADPLGSELVLCAMSMVPIGFQELVESAAAAGFDGVSVVPSVYKRGRRDEGLSEADMVAILGHYGVFVSEVEAAGAWLWADDAAAERPRQSMSDDELLRVASVLGARTLTAVHFGPRTNAERAAEPFARLCDMAADEGIRVSLEFPAWAGINDVATAWSIVQQAARSNGGILLDAWHHRRSTSDDEALLAIPGDRITALQLADGTTNPSGPLEADVLERRLPGEGELEIAILVKNLAGIGVSAPLGVEVWDKALLDQGTRVAALHLMRSVCSTLESAGLRKSQS